MTEHETFQDPAEIKHRIGATGRFSLGNASGDIRLRGADTDEVRITAQTDRGRGEPLALIVRRSEGTLHVEADQKDFTFFGKALSRGPQGIDFDVTLPRGARVEINSVSGDVEVDGLTGEQAFRSVSGDLSITRGGGRVTLTTVSGDVELSADLAVDASLTSTSGDIDLSAPSVEGLKARTVSGDLHLRGAFATGTQHHVESVSGDLLIEAVGGLTVDVRRGLDVAVGSGRRLVAGDGSAQLRFRSLSGDVQLEGAGSTPVPSQHAPARPAPPPPPPAPPAPTEPEPATQTWPAVDSETEPQPEDSLEILRALERGEIDVEEASRRLEGAASRG